MVFVKLVLVYISPMSACLIDALHELQKSRETPYQLWNFSHHSESPVMVRLFALFVFSFQDLGAVIYAY